MKASFANDPIIAMIKEKDTGENTADMSGAWDQFRDIPQIQVNLKRDGSVVSRSGRG